MEREAQLVDEVVREQVARELAATGQDQVAVELALQASDRLGGVPLEQRGVPLERALHRP